MTKVLFHVQHLLGIGHLRRAALLVRGMRAAGLEVVFLSGGMPVADLDLAGAKVIQLPPARSLDVGFKSLVDEHDQPLDARFHEQRRDQVLAAFASERPDVVLLETFPFGRRAFRTELNSLIEAVHAQRQRPALLCSIRDILVAKANPERNAGIVERIRLDFDGVLVHGDPAFVPLDASFPLVLDISDKLFYTGYVAETAPLPIGTAGEGQVIVSAGGGAVGEGLLRAALAAKPRTALRDRTWRLLTGPNLPDAVYAELSRQAGEGVILERHRTDFPEMLARCALSISQGGYNTILDILRAKARAVVVPFAAGAETEQTLRAELLAQKGVIHLVSESALEGGGLLGAVEKALAAPIATLGGVALDGAARSAELIRGFAQGNMNFRPRR